MKPGMKVTVGGRSGVVKALRPGDSVDVQFDGEDFVSRHGSGHVKPLRENGRNSRNPGKRGGLTAAEREALPGDVFALPERRFPINDRRHAVIAMQYLLRGFVRKGDEPKVLAAIKKRYPPTDPRNREIWAFYHKHENRLPVLRNPADDVYDPAKEQFRAVVQGVYESQVRKALGLPSSTEFVDARGRRLDAALEQDEKKKLLSSAYAIATRQGQKHGWLEPGTQTPTLKGMVRSAERFSEAEHAEANRQDYERTLGAVRKSGHYRVVAQSVQGQTRYVVQPRPPADLVKIPEYRLNESAAIEDAKKAEAARSKAPFDVKARSNPFYAREAGDQVEQFDIPDDPEATLVEGGDTLATIARRLGVSVQMLGRYGIVERPELEDDGSRSWAEMRPGRLIQRVQEDEQSYRGADGLPKVRIIKTIVPKLPTDRRLWDTPPYLRIDTTLVGYRITKQNIIAQFEQGEGAGLPRYASSREREPKVLEFQQNIQERLRQRDVARVAQSVRADEERARQAAAREARSSLPPASAVYANVPQADLEAELQRLKSDSKYQRYIRAQKAADEASSGITSKGAKLRIERTGAAAQEAQEKVDPDLMSKIDAIELELGNRRSVALSTTAAARPAAAPDPQDNVRKLPAAFRQALDLAAPRKVIVSYIAHKSDSPALFQVNAIYVPIRYGFNPAVRDSVVEKLVDAALGSSRQSFAGRDAVFQRDVAVFPSVEDADAAIRTRLNLMVARNDPRLADSIKGFEDTLKKLSDTRADDRLSYFTGSVREHTGEATSAPVSGRLVGVQRLYEGATAASQMAALGEAVGTIQYEMALRRCIEDATAALGPNPTIDQRIDAVETCRREADAVFGNQKLFTREVSGLAQDLRNLLLTSPEELERQYLTTALRPPDMRMEIKEAILNLKRRTETPKETQRRRAQKVDRPTGPVWDLEYITNIPRGPRQEGMPKPEPTVEERYVIYLPYKLRTITKLKRDQGMIRFSEAPSRRYVRFRGSAPARGPLAGPSVPSELYQKQDDAITEAERALAVARQSGDLKEQVAQLNKIANVRREQKRYKDAIAGIVDPFLVESYEDVLSATKLNLFNFRRRPSAQKIAGRMSLLGVAKSAPEVQGEDGKKSEFLDPNDSWVEDLSFRGEKSRLRRYDTASGKTLSLDPRTGMVKFYTTNPMLAYLTILLWNTPELFTGTTIVLPTTEVMYGRDIAVGDEEGETFTTVTVAPLTDDNPDNDPMKVYEELQAAIIRAKGVFAAAVLSGDMKEAAAAWVKLMGVHRPGAPKMSGLIEAVQKIRQDTEPIPSAKDVFGEWQYEKDFRLAAQALQEEVNVAQKMFSEGQISAEDYASVGAEATDQARVRKEVMRQRNEKNNILTSLMQADIARALIFGEKAQSRLLAAWQDVAFAVQTSVTERMRQIQQELQASRAAGYPKQVTEDLLAQYNALRMLMPRVAKIRG